MKMEQACRFRTDEAGYMVCARSQGLTADNENNLGYFNSTMTSLFEKDGSGPRMGQSILSYAVSGENGGRRLEEDPFVAELFRYLASAAPEERRQMLLDMQYILGELVPLEYASLEMIATAYHMRKMNAGNRPENDVYDRVVGNLLLCGRVPSANQETVNKLLIWMLKRQNAALPKRIMELSVDRCVKQVQADAAGGRELCDCVCRLLQYAEALSSWSCCRKR